MIITIVTVAALIAVTIYGLGQKSKLKIAMEEIATKESVNDLLRAHTKRIEAEKIADKDYIRTLRSDLQSCKDKSRISIKSMPNPVMGESKPKKANPVMGAPVKSKKPYKKKEA